MAKVSTLIHRVDGFEHNEQTSPARKLPEQDIETRFLNQLLEPLLYDPGKELVQKILKHL